MTLTAKKNLVIVLIISVSTLFITQIPSLQERSSYMAEEMRIMDSGMGREDNYYYN
jgi:hypothetical protein